MRQVDSFSVGSILATSFRFLGKNFAPLTVLVLLLGIPKILVTEQLDDRGILASFAEMLIGEMFDGLLLALLSMAVFRSLCARQLNLIETCRLTAPTLLWALLTSVVTTLLIALGMLMLMVPGIIFMVLFFVAVPVAAVEGVSTSQALGRSAELIGGHGWRVFGLLLLYPASAIAWGLLILPFIEDNSTLLALVLTRGPDLFAEAIFVITASVAYYDLRYLKDDLHLDSMKEVFE